MEITIGVANLLFYLFSSIALVSAIMVIFATNPIDSVLFLVLVFTNATGLLFLIGAEFLAIIFLVVYVGAIAVLFLFVVMMLNLSANALEPRAFVRYLPTAFFIIIIFLSFLFSLRPSDTLAQLQSSNPMYSIFETTSVMGPSNILPIEYVDTLTNVQAIGSLLYTTFSYPFILSGVILLLAMLGAIVLTLHKRSDIKLQVIADQVYRNSNTTIHHTH